MEFITKLNSSFGKSKIFPNKVYSRRKFRDVLNWSKIIKTHRLLGKTNIYL